MLDIKFIRENADLIKETIKNKQLSKKINLDDLLNLDKKLVDLNNQLIDLRQKRNKINDQIKNAKTQEERSPLIEENTKLKDDNQKLETLIASLQEDFNLLMLKVPNIVDPNMPIGIDDSENVVVKEWGKIPEFDFEPKDHIELGKLLGIIDVEKSGNISGSRFCYIKGAAALMQFAIVQLVFETLTNNDVIGKLAKEVGNPSDKPFIPVVPPVMMRPSVMQRMGRLDPIDERYELKLDELILVGSAEHTLGPIHMDEILDKKDLPIRYIGYSTAFRREAGSHGKDVRGILRVHQFDKLEMETFVPQEMGSVEQKLIVAIQEYLVQQLELPYQLMQICTGDAGTPDYNQMDINCWIPSQKTYRETHTSDYMTDYQSRRLQTKYKDVDGSNKYVYMNDATAFAIGRILIAIIENNQQKDGSVVIPNVLRKYIGLDKINPVR